DLNRLGKWSLAQLMEYKGIGEAKAITISAALELGRRRQALSPEKRPWMRTCSDAYAIMAPYLEDLPHEEFWVILMDLKSRLISTSKLSQGGAAGVSLDVPQVFEAAITAKAKRIILCHNHPSGIPNPSQLDIELTQRLIDAGEILDIKVVDHLIVGEGKYYSFTEREVFDSKIPEN
ncbi:MAG: DNA repair protein RadC, partial [Bacteroidota bacterium]